MSKVSKVVRERYPLNGHGVNYKDPNLITLILETLKRNKNITDISFLANGEWGAVFKVSHKNKFYTLKIEIINKTRQYPTASQLDRERNIMKKINDILKKKGIVSYISEPISNFPVEPMMIPSDIISSVKRTERSEGNPIGTSYKMNIVAFPFYPQTVKYCFGIPESLAKKYFTQFLRCISQCHEAGYIHRDINDGNFMFENDRFENVVLIDFGLAKMIPSREEKAIEEGSRLFNSLRVESSQTASMRDDLESIAFLTWGMIEYLPWMNGNNSKYLKEKLEGCPEWLRNVIMYSRNLGFLEKIDVKRVLEMIK